MPGIITMRPGRGAKALSIDQFPEEAWSLVLGRGLPDEGDLKDLWTHVPWLNRGISICSAGLSKMPFTIVNDRDEEIDSSEDYQNAIGIWPNPVRDLALAEAALKLFGAAYFFKDIASLRRRNAPKGERGIRYWVPTTVKPVVTTEAGLVAFERLIPGKDPETFDVDDLIYIWQYDPYTEVGAPSWSPAIAALSAAGVLKNIDEFVKLFFERGAIKTTILGIEGQPVQAEMERIKSIWGRLMKGLKTAYKNLVFNAGALTPTVVGEGLESLSNTELTNEKREDIATALGVPQSMLFSNAANFAVKEGDKRDLYEETIIPDSDIIRSAFNAQWLAPLGYRLRFDWQAMDIFQEDEEDRSGVIVNLTNALVNAPSPDLAVLVWQTAGADLPPGTDWDEMKRMLEEVKESQPQMPADAPAPDNVPAPSLRPQEGTVPEEEDDPESKGLSVDLAKWERKALKRLAKGLTASVPFDSDYIPPRLYALIREMLEEAGDAEAVRAIFRAEAV